MNIAFDAAALLGPMSKNRGIGNYSYSQLKKMIKLDQQNTYYFFNVFEEFYMEYHVTGGNIVDACFLCGKNYELAFDEEYKELFGEIIRKFLRENKIDVFYMTSPFEGHIMRYCKEWFQGVKTVATVYDIIPYVMKHKYLADKAACRFYMQRVDMLRWVDEYLVISQSVKDDMISYLQFPKERIHVIYGAADPDVYHPVEMSEQERKQLYNKYHIRGRYIMCTGGDDERKNIEGLIRAYAALNRSIIEKYQLAVVCKLSPVSMEKYRCLIHQLQLQGRVLLTGFVPDEDLVRLYNQAELMAFPSLYEGFGLPIVEAWMCGTPVLTSANSSLGEIGGDAAVLVHADSIASIAEGLEDALTKTDLESLVRKGKEKLAYFNWETVAQSALAVIHSMGKSIEAYTRIEEVKKIALFTPLPPVKSGISDYSADVIPQLSREFDIDIFIDKYKPNFREKKNVRIYPAKEFKKRHAQYDRIIYQVGNTFYHEYMFPFIKKYAGIVVLHDYNLRNVLEDIYLHQSNRPKEFMRNFLEDYGQEMADAYIGRMHTPYASQFEVNGFVVNYAERVIVHSQYAKRKLLEKNIGRTVDVIPLYGQAENDVPQGEAEQIRKEFQIEQDCLVFASFGFMYEAKRNLQALMAFERICMEQPDLKARFYFVGEAEKNLHHTLTERIRKNGWKDKVCITGYVSLKEFQKYVTITDVCINLRYPYQGESSATLMRALAKGKCVIVNKIGSFCEIPQNACIMIDSVENMGADEEVGQIYRAMKLAMDDSVRKNIRHEAKKYAETYLDLEKAGKQYIRVIKEKRTKKKLNEEKLKSFAEKYVCNYSAHEIKDLAKTFAYVVSNDKKQRRYQFQSQLCRQEQLESIQFQKMFQELKIQKWFDDFARANQIMIPAGILHRKSWEFIYITLALAERGMLKEGKRGLGFAVGTEPLPAYFASKGCEILATDLGTEGEGQKVRAEHGQNVNGETALLNKHQICGEKIFREKVTWQNVDMNEIPDELNGFDFCWSSCAIEHVGSLKKSKTFMKNMLKVLKPGGIAIHTTEYNLSSNADTITQGESVIYRKSDILELAHWFRKEGHEIETDFTCGQSEGDLFTDKPPYYQLDPRYHLRLDIGGYDSTSIGLIIRKAEET